MKPTDICDRVMLDGRFVARDEARISPLGEGFMAGHGLFETIKVRRGRPVFLEEHVARLERGAKELELSVSGELRARCQLAIDANGLEAGVLKLVVFQNDSWTGELILARTFVYPEAQGGSGWSLKLFSDERVGGRNAELKTLNYLKNSRARAAAKAAGFDEALFVSQTGVVLEGATTNVFLVKDGVVYTPALNAGILPGIARAVVLRELGEKGAREIAVTEVMLDRAEEIFVTNSLVGVMPVAKLEGRGYELRSDGVTQRIRAAFREAEERSIQ